MCGIGFVYLKDYRKEEGDERLLSVPDLCVGIGNTQQNRGQFSAGISVYNPFRAFGGNLLKFGGFGLVSEVFETANPDKYAARITAMRGVAALVHNRYCTSGTKEYQGSADLEIQPFPREHPRTWKNFHFGFNGNIVNHEKLAARLSRDHDYKLKTDVDTEVVVNLMASIIKNLSEKNGGVKRPDLFEVAEEMMGRLDGAYSAAALFADGRLLLFRDPRGFHPFVYGRNTHFYAGASESAAIEKIGVSSFVDVNPGGAVVIDENGVKESGTLVRARRSSCHFNKIYFSKASSYVDGVGVKEVRQNLGRQLARDDGLVRKMLLEEYGNL